MVVSAYSPRALPLLVALIKAKNKIHPVIATAPKAMTYLFCEKDNIKQSIS